jgi:hypothetical protein
MKDLFIEAMNDIPLPENLFRDLNDAEEKEFRQWARDNYIPDSPISGAWHPVVRNECQKMNLESI